MNINIKTNINKLHSDLTSKYDNVSINEKSSLKHGDYFEIIIKENLDVRLILPKSELFNENISWLYYTNPDDENSYLIEKTSNVNSTSVEINDILSNKRFDSEYLK